MTFSILFASVLVLASFQSQQCDGHLSAKSSSAAFVRLFSPKTPTRLHLAFSGSIDDRVSPRALVAQGMEAFQKGDVKGSIDLFDRADAKVPDGSLTPYLWQRGLSYYYADQFEDASKQFRIDVDVNPLDVEEIVWDIASQLRINQSEFPPKNMMSLPPGKKDRRNIMGTVYALFRGECNELDLAAVGHDGNIADEFYSLFYLGLYCEARGESNKAAHYMKRAVTTEYGSGRGRGDYMTSCARIHCRLRGWT